jgi:hypothetical protein
MTSIKKTDCPLAKGNKKEKTLTLETKMLVVRIMEAGEKPANVCSSLGLARANVSIIMVRPKKKYLARKITKFRAPNICYTRNFNIENYKIL